MSPALTKTPGGKVIFVNRFFYPDLSATSQMLSDLAFAMAGQGLEICVVTSRQRYEATGQDLPARETIAGVSVTRVWTSRFGRARLLGRAIDYLTFYGSAAWTLWRLAGAGDVIVAKTDPPMLSVIAAPIARWRGATLVNWLQDVFPEVAEALGVGRGRLGQAIYGLLAWLRNKSLKAATYNVVLGQRMAQRLAQTGARDESIRIIHNWADGAVIKPIAHSQNPMRREWHLGGKFVIGYSGNLGRAHDFVTMLDAISILEQRTTAAGKRDNTGTVPAANGAEFLWLFIGGGALLDGFKQQVADRGLKSVQFKPYQPRDKLDLSLSAADAHLVSLRPALEGLIVPSKFYGIAAAGRPVVFIGDTDGEIARLIEQHDCGCALAEGAGHELAAQLLKMANDPAYTKTLGANARRAFEQEFDKPIAMARWLDTLREARAK